MIIINFNDKRITATTEKKNNEIFLKLLKNIKVILVFVIIVMAEKWWNLFEEKCNRETKNYISYVNNSFRIHTYTQADRQTDCRNILGKSSSSSSYRNKQEFKGLIHTHRHILYSYIIIEQTIKQCWNKQTKKNQNWFEAKNSSTSNWLLLIMIIDNFGIRSFLHSLFSGLIGFHHSINCENRIFFFWFESANRWQWW